MKVMLLAGGLGTRLRKIISDKPKPMVDVLGRPFLEYQLRYLKHLGFTDLILSVGYMAKYIMDYFGNGRCLGLNLTYLVEESPLGTGGAIRQAKNLIDDTVMVLNGDTYYSLDFRSCLDTHKRLGGLISIIACLKEDATDYGRIVVDENGRITAFDEKPSAKGTFPVSAGAYFIEPEALDLFVGKPPLSLERDIFPFLIDRGLDLRAIMVAQEFFDIGTPERYQNFCRYVETHRDAFNLL